jgi:ABC-type phosphate transport system permease subunit
MIITTITTLVYLLFTKYIPGHNKTLSLFAIALVLLACGVALLAIRSLSEYRNGAKEPVRDPLIQD